jgi:hypothetical protein
VGGSTGEVRGETKVKTYLRCVEETKDWLEGSWHPHPSFKKERKRLMERNQDTGEWVLRFRFHT